MHETLPLYCETALNALGSFPAEPINAATSFAPVIFGVLALIVLVRHKETSRVAYTLAVLTILTGMGSIAWHAMRTELTLFLDWLPGILYFVTLVFFWFYALRVWYLGLAAIGAVIALLLFLPPSDGEMNRIVVFGVVAFLAIGLLSATWRSRRHAFSSALLMTGGAIIAATVRTMDLGVCETIPFGTHFLWHIFLGGAAYAGVRMMAQLGRDRPAPDQDRQALYPRTPSVEP